MLEEKEQARLLRLVDGVVKDLMTELERLNLIRRTDTVWRSLAASYDLTDIQVNSTVREDVIVVTLSARAIDKTKEESPNERKWKRFAPYFNLNPDWYGRTFILRGREYRIIDIRPKARKRPVICRWINSPGQRAFVFPAEMIIRELAAQKKPL